MTHIVLKMRLIHTFFLKSDQFASVREYVIHLLDDILVRIPSFRHDVFVLYPPPSETHLAN